MPQTFWPTDAFSSFGFPGIPGMPGLTPGFDALSNYARMLTGNDPPNAALERQRESDIRRQAAMQAMQMDPTVISGYTGAELQPGLPQSALSPWSRLPISQPAIKSRFKPMASLLAGTSESVAGQLQKIRGAADIGLKNLQDLGSAMDPRNALLSDEEKDLLYNQGTLQQRDKGLRKLFNTTAKNVETKAREFAVELRRRGVEEPIISQILEGVGSAMVEVPALMATGEVAGPFNFMLHGMARKAGESEGDITEIGKGGAEGAIMDAVFQGYRKVFGKAFDPKGPIVKQALKRGEVGAAMATASAVGPGLIEDVQPTLQDVVSSFVTGAVLPTFSGVKGEGRGKVKFPELKGLTIKELVEGDTVIGKSFVEGKRSLQDIPIETNKVETISIDTGRPATQSFIRTENLGWRRTDTVDAAGTPVRTIDGIQPIEPGRTVSRAEAREIFKEVAEVLEAGGEFWTSEGMPVIEQGRKLKAATELQKGKHGLPELAPRQELPTGRQQKYTEPDAAFKSQTIRTEDILDFMAETETPYAVEQVGLNPDGSAKYRIFYEPDVLSPFYSGFPFMGGKKRNFIKSNIDSQLPPEYKEASWLYRALFNSGESVDKLSSWAKKAGIDVKDARDPALLAAASRGWLGQAHAAMEKGPFRMTPDADVEFFAPGMREFLVKAQNGLKLPWKETQVLLDEYFETVRVLTDLQAGVSRLETDPTTGKKQMVETTKATPAEIKRAQANATRFLEMPVETRNELQAALAVKNQYQHGLLDMMEGGFHSAEEIARIKAENPNHVPFERMIADDTPGIWSQMTGRVPRKPQIINVKGKGGRVKKFKGSEKEIYSPLESMVQRTYSMVRAMNENRVKLAITDMAEFLPDIIRKVPVKVKPTDIAIEEIKVQAEKAGGTLTSGELEKFRIWRPEQFKGLETNQMTVWRNGKLEVWEVPASISKEFMKYDPGVGLSAGKILTALLGPPKRTLQRGATLDMGFALANFVKDNFTAFFQNEVGFVPFVDPVKASFEMAGKNDLYYKFLASGASLEGYGKMSRKNLQKDIRELTGNKKLFSKLNPIARLEDFTNYFEQRTRRGVFLRAKKKGLSDLAAMKASREATLDFARSGEIGRALNKGIPFFNAGLQGTNMIGRAFKKHPISSVAKLGLPVITVELLTHMLGMREENKEAYLSAKDWEKDYFWSFFSDGEPLFRIPKPHGWGQVGSIMGRAFRYISGEDPEAFNNAFPMLVGGMTPVDSGYSLLPVALKLGVESLANWNFFKDGPLYSPYKEDQLARDRSTEFTPEIYKQIGGSPLLGKEGISPAKLQHITEGLTGSLGRETMKVLSGFLFPGTETRPSDPALKDVPFVGRFIPRRSIGSGSKQMQSYYEKFGTLNQARNSYKEALKEGNFDEALRISRDFPKATTGEFKNFQKINDQMRFTRDAIRGTIESKDLDDDQKRQAIRAYEQILHSLAIQGLGFF